MAETWVTPTFDDIATDEFVTAAQLNVLGNNLRFLLEINYTQTTSSLTVTATTAATAQEFITSGAITYDTDPIWIHFFCPRVDTGTTSADAVRINLYDGSTDLGRWWDGSSAGAGSGRQHIDVWRRMTPTAASHTFNARVWKNAGATGTSQLVCGAGGTDTMLPAFIHIYRAIL